MDAVVPIMAGKAMPSDTGRLAGFCRVNTASVDAAAEQIGRIFCPHALEPVKSTSHAFSARHHCAPFDGFSINYVAYGGSVAIDPGCLERFFLVQIPLAGFARVRTAARDIECTPGVTASLLSPTVPTQMRWENDCAQLILLIERRLVEQRAAALAGKATRDVEFDPLIDLRRPAGRRLQTQLEGLADLAEGLGATGPLSAVAAADCREALLDALLTRTASRPVRCDQQVLRARPRRLPVALRRARDCLRTNACRAA